jgi:mannose-6-phosphate isomerase class I
MREVCDLPDGPPNYAWCFDCVPEENSLLLNMAGVNIEIPAMDLVLYHPRQLLGDAPYARFGAEFPMRFDFLDTMQGGNLSLQVHPLHQYIVQNFGMAYTQDESYYLLDAAPDACVYLGLKAGIDRNAMISDLRHAQENGARFEASNYVNQWPARKHDHFLIPAGTIHCSGAIHLYLQTVGLGTPWTGWPPAPDPLGTRCCQYSMGSGYRMGTEKSGESRREDWRGPRLDRGKDRIA